MEKFPDLQLPGFESEANLWDIVGMSTDWQTVLSLSIYSRNPDNPQEIDVLTGIRADSTETHPNVVSTPTGRFPQQFQAPLLASRRAVYREIDSSESSHARAKDIFIKPGHFRLDQVGIRENQVAASFEPNITELPNREDPLAFLAHETLARKLGLGEVLQKTKELGAIGTISLSEVIAGFSYAADEWDTDTPLWEPLLMYASIVMLNDRSLIPAQTKAYRKISWVSVDNFLEGQRTKKSELLIPGIDAADEATVCVRGLCLTTTSTVSLVARQLRSHLGLS